MTTRSKIIRGLRLVRFEKPACRRRRPRRGLKPPKLTLEFQLCEILSTRAGERGDNEGAIDTLCRIIGERDRALTLIALERIKTVPV